jgi:hypothetical protein
MSNPKTKSVTSRESSSQKARKSETREVERKHHGKNDDDREQNAAKYREKVDELNRSRDIDIERALTLRAGH